MEATAAPTSSGEGQGDEGEDQASWRSYDLASSLAAAPILTLTLTLSLSPTSGPAHTRHRRVRRNDVPQTTVLRVRGERVDFRECVYECVCVCACICA